VLASVLDDKLRPLADAVRMARNAAPI